MKNLLLLLILPLLIASCTTTEIVIKNVVDDKSMMATYNECIREIEKNNINFKNHTVIGVIYRTPGSNVDEFNVYIKDTLEKIKKENKTAYYMGDTNINLLNSSNHTPTSEYLDIKKFTYAVMHRNNLFKNTNMTFKAIK